MDDSPQQSVSLSDLEIGSVIGTGAFATVYKVRLNPEDHTRLLTRAESTASDASCRGQLSSHYALKRLHGQDKLSCPKKRASAVKDLAREVEIFSKLSRQHENIVTLHAISDAFWSTHLEGDGFLILELLHETLETRLKRWRRRLESEKSNSSFFLPFTRRRGELQEQQTPRERQLNLIGQIGLPIARAMAFIHGHNICYRDLKPCNVGFDGDDTVRLFDFGCSRDLDEADGRRLTPFVGTLRYSAPELIRGNTDYSIQVDIYAFSLLLWEILTFKKPFKDCRCPTSIENMVVHGEKRPPLDQVKVWDVKPLLKFGWHKNPDLRPSFVLLVRELERIVADGRPQRRKIRNLF
jgi:serine/threonine protein kinase